MSVNNSDIGKNEAQDVNVSESFLSELKADSDLVKSLLTDGYVVLPSVLSEEECNKAVDKIWDFISTVGYNVDREKPRSWYPKPHPTWGRKENSIEDPWPQTFTSDSNCQEINDTVQNLGAGWLLGETRELLIERVFEKHIFKTKELLCSKEGFIAQRPLIVQAKDCPVQNTKGRRNRKKKPLEVSIQEEKKDLDGDQKETEFVFHPRVESYVKKLNGKPHSIKIEREIDCPVLKPTTKISLHIQSLVSFVDEDSEGNDGCFVCWPGSHNHTIQRTVLNSDYHDENKRSCIYLNKEEMLRIQSQFSIQKKLVPIKKGDVILWMSNLIHAAAGPSTN